MTLNPGNATPIALTFKIAGTTASTDTLGNPTLSTSTVVVSCFVTPLSISNLQQVQQSLGADRSGEPVKVRVAAGDGTFPAALTRGKVLEATCTYGGRAAIVALKIGGANPQVAGVGLLAKLGQSVYGLVTWAS